MHAVPSLLTINDLPDNVLCQILRLLRFEESILYASRVSKKWRFFSLYVITLKHCQIFDIHDEICQLDFDCPLQRCLRMMANNGLSEKHEDFDLDAWLLRFTAKILRLFGSRIETLSFQTRRHNLISCRYSFTIHEELIEMIQLYCSKLKDLNLLRCNVTSSAALLLLNLPNLKALRLNNEMIIDEIWPDLALKLKDFESRMVFGRNFVNDDSASDLIVRPNLTAFKFHGDLTDPQSGPQPYLPMDAIVKTYPNLTNLDVRNCKIEGSILGSIGKLKFLDTLAIHLVETTSSEIVTQIADGCRFLIDLTIIDRCSNGSIDLAAFLKSSDSAGNRLKRLAFDSSSNVSCQQMNAILNFINLEYLVIRTNLLPCITDEEPFKICQPRCIKLKDLCISSSSLDEQRKLYFKLFENNRENFEKLAYLPRGWSLHHTDGIDPDHLCTYLNKPLSSSSSSTNNNSDGYANLVKLLLYVENSSSSSLYNLFSTKKFTNLTGLIIFGKFTMDKELCSKIGLNSPNLQYLLTESEVVVDADCICSFLKFCPNLQELHIKYKQLEAHESFCREIGRHSKLKCVAFRGILRPRKVKFNVHHWNQIMDGRIELLIDGRRTCQRLFIDCFYDKERLWPKKLADAMRKLNISCRGFTNIDFNYKCADDQQFDRWLKIYETNDRY